MRRFVAFLLRYHLAVLVLLVVVTLGFTAVLPRAIIATNFADLFFSKDEGFDRYLARTHDMTNDHGVFVGIEEAEPLSVAALDRLQRAVDAIRGVKEVRRVTSLLDAGTLQDDGVDLTFPKYAEEARAHPERIPQLLRSLTADPMWARMLIAENGLHTAMIVEIEPDESRKAEAEADLVRAIYAATDAAGYDRKTVHLGGTSAVTAEMFSQIHQNLTTIFPVVVLVLFVVGYLMFRQLWPVLITLTVALLSVIWTSGFALLIDPKVNLFLSIVPVLILVISFSDVIHLCSAYLLELGTGKPKSEAILAMGTDVGAACFFTSVTTFVGFTSLAFVPSPVMRQFGIVLGFGVAATLLIALTLVPVLLKIMREPPLPRRATLERSDWIARLLQFAEKTSINRPVTVVVVSLVVVLVSFVGLHRLQVDASLLQRLSKDNPVRQDADYFQQYFSGTGTLSVFIESADGRDLLDPDRFQAIAAFQDRIAELPGVNQVVSMVELVRATHLEMREPEDTSLLPQGRDVMMGYLLMYELAGMNALDRSLSPDKRTLQLVLRLETSSFRETYNLGKEIGRIGNESLGAGVSAEPGGLLFFLGRWLDEFIDGQKRGLLFSIVSIALIMMIGLRSIRNGALSMIPNLLPLVFLGGFIGLAYDMADSDTMIVAMIAIGIAVDDTIHFMMRFRIESLRNSDMVTAVRETFHFAGRAIVVTSVILVVGFVPLMLSDYATFVMFGTLLPLTLIMALIADLFLTPALTRLGWIRYPMGEKARDANERPLVGM